MAFVVAYKSRIITTVRVMPSENMYRTSAIISRGLYIFYPIFHCGLYCRAVSIADSLCNKLRLGAQSVTLLSTLRDPTQLR